MLSVNRKTSLVGLWDEEEFMTAEEFAKQYPVTDRVRVRWGEMDSLGHVNNVMFFRYFESIRMLYWDLMAESIRGRVKASIGPILASTQCRYKKPLYYPDQIILGTKVTSVQEDRFTMMHAVWSEKEQLIVAEGEGVLVSYDYELKTKVALPDAWREFMAAAETHAP